jgi:hypothetical protein
MNSKNIFIVALGALCGLAFAPGMAQAKETKISGRFAQANVVDTTTNTSDASTEGKGTFGKFTARSTGSFGEAGAPSENCEGFDFELPNDSLSIVLTYADLSQLHVVAVSGYTCGSLDGTRAYVVETEIVGGSGRFEGATGTATLEAEGTQFSPNMAAYTGTFTGTVSLDD